MLFLSNIFKVSALATALMLCGSIYANAQEYMTEKELLSTLPGATIYGISEKDGKTRWVQTYGKGRKKGNISGVFGKDKYKAKWSISGNVWCEDWGCGNGCWQIVRIDAKTLQPHKGTYKSSHVLKIK